MLIFRKSQQFNARAGQEKNPGFFGNARPKSNARAHLKQRRKHSGLSPGLSWALLCKQTDCITAGISKQVDPTLEQTPSEHKTFLHFIQCLFDRRQRRWAGVV